jgi:hypothetical protein
MNAMSEKDRERLDKVESELLLCKQNVNDKLDNIDGGMAGMKASIDGMCGDVSHIKEIMTAWNNVKGFVTVVSLLARFIKAVAVLGAFFGTIYYVVTHGSLPTKGG